MDKYQDILIINTEDGNRVCVDAPSQKAFIGDVVRTTSGATGTVTNLVRDYTGEIRKILSIFTAVQVAEAIYSVTWTKEGKDA